MGWCWGWVIAAGKRDRYGLFEEANAPGVTCPKFTYKWILGNSGPSAKKGLESILQAIFLYARPRCPKFTYKWISGKLREGLLPLPKDRTYHVFQPQWLIPSINSVSPLSAQNLITARFLALHFFAKNLKFYKPRKTCGFYNHSIGESQPMWITDSRVKPVESVWSLVGIETLAQSGAPMQ